MKLNLGCQIHYFDGWTNQDVVSDDPGIKAEIYCDAAKLPLDDNSVDFIYAGHLVEHYYPDTLGDAIKEWHRVLKPGGKIVIVTPDSGMMFRLYASGQCSMEDMMQPVYGRIYSYDNTPERHHIVFDIHNLTTRVNQAAPWMETAFMDFSNPPEELKTFMDTHISRSNTQLGLILVK